METHLCQERLESISPNPPGVLVTFVGKAGELHRDRQIPLKHFGSSKPTQFTAPRSLVPAATPRWRWRSGYSGWCFRTHTLKKYAVASPFCWFSCQLIPAKHRQHGLAPLPAHAKLARPVPVELRGQPVGHLRGSAAGSSPGRVGPFGRNRRYGKVRRSFEKSRKPGFRVFTLKTWFWLVAESNKICYSIRYTTVIYFV